MAILASTVFCDDVRTENNGKHIIIGAYGSDMVPGTMPSTFPIALWIRVDGLPLGKAAFRFEIEMPGGKNKVAMEGEGELRESGRPAIMVFNQIPCSLESYGHIICRLSIAGAEPVEIGRLAVSRPPDR